MRYLPEKYTYTNEPNGRSVYALSPSELYETLRVNDCLGPKQGQYVYVRSFGNMPLIFCIPASVRLYGGNGGFYLQDEHAVRMAIELAQASRATVVFPLRTFYHPHVDPAVQHNPLLCTLSEVIEKLGAALYIEVYSINTDHLVREIFIDSNFGVATLGWPSLIDFMQFKIAPTRLLKTDSYAKKFIGEGVLPVWIRKTFLIPAVSLTLFDDYSLDKYGLPVDEPDAWERLKADFTFAIPEIIYHVLLVKRERDRRGVISFEDELRLGGIPQSTPAPTHPFPTAASYILPFPQPVPNVSEQKEENIEELLERAFAESNRQ